MPWRDTDGMAQSPRLAGLEGLVLYNISIDSIYLLF